MRLAGGRVGRLIQVDQREHLAPNRLVAHPVDQVRPPLHRLRHMGQGKEIRAQAFGIHG